MIHDENGWENKKEGRTDDMVCDHKDESEESESWDEKTEYDGWYAEMYVRNLMILTQVAGFLT